MNSTSEPGIPQTSPIVAAAFPRTHWSVVLTAAQSESPQSQDALAKLCSAYWYPLYALIRRRGNAPHEAEDLTQEFFARLLGKHYLEGITEEGGRFRSYLLTALKHFLANEWQKLQAQKRGGTKSIVSLDLKTAEDRYQFEPADEQTPEIIFERRWASALLDQVMGRLRDEYLASGKEGVFDRFRACLSGDKSQIPYAELGAGWI